MTNFIDDLKIAWLFFDFLRVVRKREPELSGFDHVDRALMLLNRTNKLAQEAQQQEMNWKHNHVL